LRSGLKRGEKGGENILHWKGNPQGQEGKTGQKKDVVPLTRFGIESSSSRKVVAMAAGTIREAKKKIGSWKVDRIQPGKKEGSRTSGPNKEGRGTINKRSLVTVGELQLRLREKKKTS